MRRRNLLALSLIAAIAATGGTVAAVDSVVATAATGPNCATVDNVTNPDGSITQTLTLDGTTSTETFPWPGFNPATASNDQLNKFNIPDRPTDPTALHDWLVEWTTTTLTPIGGLCETGQASPFTPLTASTGQQGTRDWNNSAWTGYVSGAAGKNYTDTTGYSNVVQGINNNCGALRSSVTAWVGLESPIHNLTQAGWGTAAGLPANAGAAQFWYEQWPAEGARFGWFPTAPIRDGDQIYMHVHYNSTGPTYHLADVTQGTSWAPRENWLQAFGGSRIDAISERFGYPNGTYDAYRPYTGAAAIYQVKGNGAGLYTQTPRGGWMVNPDTGDILGEVGGIYTPGDFNTYHYNCV